MKRRAAILIALLLASTLPGVRAQSVTNSGTPPKLPGTELAQNISTITGVAISPLLGVGAIGAYQYFKAETPEQRAKLHWYANPWFWGPALLLVMLSFIKDTAGTALPTALKKPLDVAETIEHKISGLVATGAFVPLAVAIFENHGGNGDGASLAAAGFAAIDSSTLYNALMIPVFMIAFFIVFLASNAINILILLSPFTTVDMGLKAFRTVILASVVATAWANPWVGAAWALVIIIFAYFIAGWSFRLSHFGLLVVWDFVTLRRNRFKAEPEVNKMFLSRKIDRVPARTYGKLKRDAQGNLVLHYRPWLIRPTRTLILPPGRYEVGCGFFYSEIMRLEGNETKTILLLPPRYIGHENELVSIYGLAGTRKVGIRAAWAWLRGMVGNKPLPPRIEPTPV